MNGDGEIGVADALSIFKYIAGIDVTANPQGYLVGDTVKIEQKEIDMSKMPEIIAGSKMPETTKDSFLKLINDELPGVDLSDFSFEQRSYNPYDLIGSYAPEKGDRAFNVYYKNVLLYPEKYDFILRECTDGYVEAIGGIWNERSFENAYNLDLEPTISENDAIKASKEYSDGLPVPDNIGLSVFTVKDEKEICIDQIVIYSLEKLEVAYKTRAINGFGINSIATLFTYVDIKTGEVLGHDFSKSSFNW